MKGLEPNDSLLFSPDFNGLCPFPEHPLNSSRGLDLSQINSLDPSHNPRLLQIWSDFLDSNQNFEIDYLNDAKSILKLNGSLKTSIELVKDHVLACRIFADSFLRVFAFNKSESPNSIDWNTDIEELLSASRNAAKYLGFDEITQSEIQRGMFISLRNFRLSSLFHETLNEEGLSKSVNIFLSGTNALSFLPQIFVCDSVEDTKKAAALYLAVFFKYQPPTHYFGATGITQEGVIQEWIRFNQKYGVNLGCCTLSHIDQYFGCPDKANESFVRYVQEKYLPLGFHPLRAVYLNGVNPTTQEAWAQREIVRELYNWERIIIDKHSSGLPTLIHMGIGPTADDYNIKNCTVNPESSDPHIAFVPSGTPFTDRIGVYNLERGTIARDLERGQEERTQAISLGVRAILGASNKILVATGAEKGRSLAISLTPHVGEDRQASALMLAGKSCVMFIDKDAADILSQGLNLRNWDDGIYPAKVE